MASRTVIQLRHAAARRMRDHWQGTLTSTSAVAATTLTDTRRKEISDYFVNGFVQVGGSGDTPEHHRISANVQSTGVMTLAWGLAAEWASGKSYEIHRAASAQDYNQFIVDAVLDMASEMILGNQSSTSLSLTANAAKPAGLEDEYTIPTGFRYISEVGIDDGAGFYNVVPLSEVTPMPGSTRKLRFSPWALSRYGGVGRTIRLLGQGEQDLSAITDATSIICDPSFVLEYIILQFLHLRAAGSGRVADAARQRINAQTQVVEIKRAAAGYESRVPAGALVVPL